MEQKTLRIVTLSLCVLMLAALFMPLVSMLSYGWNLTEMIQKMPPLMKTWQAVALYLIAIFLVAGPVLSGLGVLMRNSSMVSCEALYSFVIAVILFVMTLIADAPINATYGLYVYLVAAFAVIIMGQKIKKQVR